MSKKKRFEKLRAREPFIICIDDLGSSFEMVYWTKTEEEAIKCYDSWDGDYPDRKGRNKHIFKMIRTTGQDLQDSGGKD